MTQGSSTLTRRRLIQGGSAAAGAALVQTVGVDRATAATGYRLHLARRSMTRYRIYLGTLEDIHVQHAATELADYLSQITGAEFPVIVSDTAPVEDGHLIVLGSQNPMAADFPSVDTGQLGEDGFAYRTLRTNLLIVGAGSRGVLYGVHWLLDRVLGVRWFSPEFTVVPNNPDLDIPVDQLAGDHAPRFRYRQLLFGAAADPAYRQHNLLNGGRTEGSGWAAGTVPAELDTWSTYWPVRSFGATYRTMVPDQTLWAGGQLQMMNEATRQMAADNLITVINQRISDGKDPAYGFVQNDALWSAPDDDSRSFADAHGGSLAAPMLDMINDIETRVRQQIPDARLATQAYMFSYDVPTGVVPNPDIVMTVCPIYADFGQPLLSETRNPYWGGEIEAWSAVSDELVIWNYLVGFGSYLQPFPNWWAAAESIKQLAALPGVQGHMGQGAHSIVGSELAHLRVWTLSRLMWDPSLDYDALVAEFVAGFYGAAAPHILDYLHLMVAAKESTGARLPYTLKFDSPYLNFDTMHQADALMALAEAAVTGDPQRTAHVRNVRLGVDMIILLHRAKFQAEADAGGISWSADTVNRLARFDAELTESGATKTDIRGETPAQLRALVQLERTVPPPPAAVAGLPDSDWVDLQDLVLFKEPRFATLVADPLASDGYALRMVGNSPAWGVQARLYLLPPEGEWRIHVVVRTVAAVPAPTGTAFSAGGYPVGAPVYVSAASVNDGEYHEVALPGTYRYLNEVAYVYVAPPNSTQITEILIDRMFAIRVGD